MRSSTYPSVTDTVASAKGAYSRYMKLTLDERREILERMKKALRSLAGELAAITVAETGMGIVQNEAQKIKLAVEEAPDVKDLITGVGIGDHETTLYELSSLDIVCAVQPCTSPYAALISNTIGMLATRNAIIHCPCPGVIKVSQFLTTIIGGTIRSISGIDSLIITLHGSPTGFTTEVISHPDIDLVACTGDNGSLRQIMTSGKKVIGIGSANPVAIMGVAVNLGKVARDTVRGASFDNNLTCTSEKCVVVEESVSGRFIYELLRDGVYYIRDGAEIRRFLSIAVTGDFVASKKLEGQSAKEILEYVGIPASEAMKLIVTKVGRMHPFTTTELMMPLVLLVETADFNETLEIVLGVEQGYKHTATIRSESVEHLNRAARELQTSTSVKNGPSLMGTGFDKRGHTSFTIAITTGEGTTTAKYFTRRRRCTLASGFPTH